MNLDWQGLVNRIQEIHWHPVVVGLSLGNQKLDPLKGFSGITHYTVSRAAQTQMIQLQIKKLIAQQEETNTWFDHEKIAATSATKIKVKRKLKSAFFLLFGLVFMLLFILLFEWYATEVEPEQRLPGDKPGENKIQAPGPGQVPDNIREQILKRNPGLEF